MTPEEWHSKLTFGLGIPAHTPTHTYVPALMRKHIAPCKRNISQIFTVWLYRGSANLLVLL